MPLVIGCAALLGLLGAAAWPVVHHGHASSVQLTPGWPLIGALVLGSAMFGAARVATWPARRTLTISVIIALLTTGMGAAARTWLLSERQGTGRHWADGLYVLEDGAARTADTLALRDGRYELGQNWSGAWEWSGWTVVLSADPGCPGARGAYHVHDAGGTAIRFVKVVDACADGSRAEALDGSVWDRTE